MLMVLALMGLNVQAQNLENPMQGELMRSTTGRSLDASGFSAGSVPLQKGAVYDVVRQENGNVVLNVNGQNVVLQAGAVRITPKPMATAATVATPGIPSGFVPGKIVLVSARYTIENDQPRNVKNNLQKLIPQTVITAPLSIPVTDALSTAAQDQGNVSQSTVVITSSTTATVYTRRPSRNVLTVQYLYNGQKFTKQVPEGQILVLP